MEFLSLLVLFLSVTGKHCASSLNASRSNNTACDLFFQYKCGDVCLTKLIGLCLCGTKFISNWDILRNSQNMNYCCTHPSVKCTKTKYGAFCPLGKVLEAGHFPAYDVDKFNVTGATPCHGQCYNDYQTSKHISEYSHYTCPDKCVHWSGMCRGVSYCDGDQEICGDDLRCPVSLIAGIVKKHTMQTVPPRSYCFEFKSLWGFLGGSSSGVDRTFGGLERNDGGYDNIDRSDEEIIQSDDEGRVNVNLNYTALRHCWLPSLQNRGCNGRKCGDTCLGMEIWCRGIQNQYCENALVKSNDPVLCSNHTFWHNIDCDVNFYGGILLRYFGKRCTGPIKHCYYPELYWDYQMTDDYYEQGPYTYTCADMSDRVFDMEQPCPENVCKNWAWDIIPCPEDRENFCWESCSNPGHGCTACTNSSHFQCPQSQKCVHPHLRCDGHPQCEHGEDEDLDECRELYTENNVISKYATYRCKSIMYPVMETYASTCNGFPECVDAEDESFCSDNTTLYIILPTTMGFIATMYLMLKFWRLAYRRYKNGKYQRMYSFQLNSLDTLLETYSKCHGTKEDVDKINSLLLNLIFSESKEEIKKTCRDLYAFEEKVHNNDKSEIVCCLHKNLDPIIMEHILDNQFPGIIKKCMDYLDTKKGFNIVFDFIEENEHFNNVKNTITRLVKMELEYLDILKDSYFAFTLLSIVGGHQAIFDFPTNFSIVVVLCFFGSIIFPIMFATLHLATHNPCMIFYIMPSEKVQSRMKKTIMALLCCILSFLNPVLLLNAYEGAKERMKRLALTMHPNVVQEMRNTKAIKNQWITFIKIELGKSPVQ